MPWVITLILLLHAVPAFSEAADDQAISPISLAELALSADLVVVAQVKDTDYFMRRDIPVSGSA